MSFKILIHVDFNLMSFVQLSALVGKKSDHVISLVPLITNRQAGVTATLVFLWHYGG